MFTNFEELKLNLEQKRLDRQIDKLMAVQSFINDVLDEVPFKEKLAYDLLNKKYWDNSEKLKTLFSVQENIEKIIEWESNKAAV